MSRYGSLDAAIRMVEECRRIAKNADEVITDLQSLAVDVRYGGKWVGEFESVAAALDKCVNMECPVCPYRGSPQGCRSALKKDAAACIRQMAEMLGERKGGKGNVRKIAEKKAKGSMADL